MTIELQPRQFLEQLLFLGLQDLKVSVSQLERLVLSCQCSLLRLRRNLLCSRLMESLSATASRQAMDWIGPEQLHSVSARSGLARSLHSLERPVYLEPEPPQLQGFLASIYLVFFPSGPLEKGAT